MNARGPALLYPDRKRCFTCRQRFGFVVVDGLYDSWECAPRGRPSSDPDDWPREHYSWQVGRVKQEKRDWLTQKAAERAAKQQGKEPYKCGYCLGWHIGKRNPVA